MYSIEYSRGALKTLRAMARNVRELIKDKVKEVAADPHGVHHNVTRLKGRAEFRLRVQDWRVIYRLDDGQMVLLVIKIGARGQVYQ